MNRLVAVLVLLGLVATGVTAAQPTDISGRWTAESATSIRRNKDGSVEVLATSDFRFDVTVEGESVKAVWQRLGETSEAPVVLTGTWKAGRLDLTSAWTEATTASGGRSGTPRIRWVMRGSISDGRLGGTRHLEVEGRSTDPALISWTARRQSTVVAVAR